MVLLKYFLVLTLLHQNELCCKLTGKFANSLNDSGWESLTQRRQIARLCALYKAYAGRRAWKSIGDRLLRPCYLSRDDHNLKIRTRKQRTDVGKYSFVNRTIRNWNQLPAGVLATSPCKLNTFRKRIRNAVAYRGIKLGNECD